eukprot:Polyplicarium_translucidae@DN2839_c0_g1_i3.p1
MIPHTARPGSDAAIIQKPDRHCRDEAAGRDPSIRNGVVHEQFLDLVATRRATRGLRIFSAHHNRSGRSSVRPRVRLRSPVFDRNGNATVRGDNDNSLLHVGTWVGASRQVELRELRQCRAGPDGSSSVHSAVDAMKGEQGYVLAFFVVGLVSFAASNVLLFWCYFERGLAISASVILSVFGVLVLYFACEIPAQLRVAESSAVVGKIDALHPYENIGDLEQEARRR